VEEAVKTAEELTDGGESLPARERRAAEKAKPRLGAVAKKLEEQATRLTESDPAGAARHLRDAARVTYYGGDKKAARDLYGRAIELLPDGEERTKLVAERDRL